MRIITTFNDVLYRTSGQAMLDSVRALLPRAEVLVYEEFEEEATDLPSVRVDRLPEFQQVYENYRHLIPTEMGGTNEFLHGYNRRWFGWFRKVVMQFDALTRNTYDGYTILLDTDARIVKPFSDELIEQTLRKPVGVFRGTRSAIEAGVVLFDGRSQQAVDFVTGFMEVFLSGTFRNLERWDDGFVMEHCRQRMPQYVHDLAEGLEPIQHTNSNGHSTPGHVLPQTIWGEYIEHDKGLHWRKGVVPQPDHIMGKPPIPNFLRRMLIRVRNRTGF